MSKLKKPAFPRTTPECKRLLKIVLRGLDANIFSADERRAARAALKRLCKKRCAKAVEYVCKCLVEATHWILSHVKSAIWRRNAWRRWANNLSFTDVI